jgi:hypothetical protein
MMLTGRTLGGGCGGEEELASKSCAASMLVVPSSPAPKEVSVAVDNDNYCKLYRKTSEEPFDAPSVDPTPDEFDDVEAYLIKTYTDNRVLTRNSSEDSNFIGSLSPASRPGFWQQIHQSLPSLAQTKDKKSTTLHEIVWENTEDDDMLQNTSDNPKNMRGSLTRQGGFKVKTSISIPSWSKQDRFKRALVIRKPFQLLFGSSFFLGLVFIITYLVPEIFRDPEGSANRSSIVISLFICMQTLVTMLTAIPGEDSTNQEVNRRINASILIAMTLYPCLGLWMATRPQQLTTSNAWEALGIDHLWDLQDDVSGRYQNGDT